MATGVEEARALIGVADSHMLSENIDEALNAAQDALDFFRRTSDNAGTTAALDKVIRCYAKQERKKEAISLGQSELATARQASNTLGEATIMLALAEVFASMTGSENREEALLLGTEALGLFRNLSDSKMEAKALLALVTINIVRIGNEIDFDEGIKAASQVASDALEIYQRLRDPRGEAEALHAIGMVQAADDKFDEAITAAEEALQIYQDLKDRSMEVFELVAMSRWFGEAQKPGKALKEAQEALHIARLNGVPMSREITAWQAVVKSFLMKGSPEKAFKEAKEGFARFTEANATRQIEDSHVTMFLANYNVGWIDEAIAALEAAREVASQRGNSEMEAELTCGLAQIYMSNGDMAKADEVAYKAMALAEDAKCWNYMLIGMQTACSAKLAAGELSDANRIDARNAAQAARDKFEEVGATIEEGYSCLMLAQISIKTGELDKAATYAKAAQELAYQEGEEQMEAECMMVLVDIYMQDSKFQKAIRASNQAQRLFYRLEMLDRAANAQNLKAQATLNDVLKKIQLGKSENKPSNFDEALEQSKQAVDLCKTIPKEDNGIHLLGNANAVLGQVLVYRNEGEAGALKSVEAIGNFSAVDDERGEAYAWCWAAQGAILLKLWPNAKKDANQGLKLFTKLKDEKGIEYAEKILAEVEKLAPPPEPPTMFPGYEQWLAQQQASGGPTAWKMPPGAPKTMGGMMPTGGPGGGGGGGGGQEAGSVQINTGGALQMSAGISEDLVTGKVKEVVLAIIADEDEEFELDTPLMEAGLTSSTAVILRDQLMTDMPGINLPPTLIFDYPSTVAIVEFVMEKAAKL